MSEPPSSLVERMLAERIGLDPSSVGHALMARAIGARMDTLGLKTRSEYDRALTERGDEVQALVEEVVVPESWFFRDERPFEMLAGSARGWLSEPARPPLTALSIPCAGGEEPYSIAVTLLETGLPADRFRVDAVDVSVRSVARAIAGVYGPNAFRGSGTRAHPTHFREHHGAFAVEPVVRSTVRFHLGNLLDPKLFADRPPFDVVFCRNLLIYFDDEAKSRAFVALSRLVAADGLLFLGHADRLDTPEGSPFEPTGDRGAFAFRKVGPKPTASRFLVKPTSSLQLAPKSSSSPLPPGVVPGVRVAARRVGMENRTSSGLGGSGHDPHPRPLFRGERGERQEVEPPAQLLERASNLADSGRYGEATALVEAAIRGGAGASAYFLLGLIAQAAGHRDQAEGHYLKAVYLDPQHDEALLALALLARRKGDIGGEAAYRKRAGRVLARKTTS